MDIAKFLSDSSSTSQTYNLENTVTSKAADKESLNVVNESDRFTLVLDCDDLLVDISTKWCKKIKQNSTLSHYISDTTEVVEMRDTYYLNNWLKIENEHTAEFLSLYYDDATFYDDLIPSPIMNSILNILDYVEEIHILTNCGSDLSAPVNKSKLKWLKAHFANKVSSVNPSQSVKFKVHAITSDYKDGKGGFLRDNNISFNTFADDSLENIYSVMEHVQHVNKYEILLPVYGFNHTLNPDRIPKGVQCLVQSAHNTHKFSPEDFSKMLAAKYDKQEEAS